MHYHAEVWINDKHNVENQITTAMAPYNEADAQEGEPYSRRLWDWYEIGGRWEGAHVHPTHVNRVGKHLTCHTLILPDTPPICIDYFNGTKHVVTDFRGNVKDELKRRGINKGYLVTVDYHR